MNAQQSEPPTPADPRGHFGFTEWPFTSEIAVGKMWRHPDVDELVDDLEATVSARWSAAVVAPSGTGKTALLRRLLERLPDTRYRVVDVKVTAVSNRDFYRGLARTLGLTPAGTWPSLLDALQVYARTLATTEARRLVIIVDEAQDMRPEVLSTIRMLTNFNLDSELVISVILVGDSALDTLLHRPDMDSLRSRLARVARLRLLSRPETRSYIEHRLDIVGARHQLLDDSAVEAVFDYSRGNLRAIDHLCRTALTLAANKSLDTVDAGLVTVARKRLP